MLLLVTIGLVLVAAVTLVIGFVSNTLAPIVVSIICSFSAAVVLTIFYRMNRGRRAAPAGGRPSPLVDTTPPVFSRTGTGGAAASPSPSSFAPSPTYPEPPSYGEDRPRFGESPAADDRPTRQFRRVPPQPPTAPAEHAAPSATTQMPVAAGRSRPAAVAEPSGPDADAEASAAPGAEAAGGWDDELPFPIEDYDDLRAVEILPLLPELDDQELGEIRAYEQAHRNRLAIIGRIDALVAESAPETGGDGADKVEGDVEGGAGAAAELPIADYDFLGVSEILPLLSELDENELESVRSHEKAGRGRATIVYRIDSLLGRAAETPSPEGGGDEEPEGAGEAEYPIAEYDKLRVFQILLLLPELDEDELHAVRDYEQAGRSRVTILNQIDARLAEASAAPPPTREVPAGPDEAHEVNETAPEAASPATAAEAPSEAEPNVSAPPGWLSLPIADYDELSQGDILPLLDELDDRELAEIRDFEDANRARVAILYRIDTLLGHAEPQGEPGPEADEIAAPPAAETPMPRAAEEEPDWPELPIAEYDLLSQGDILPLLDELDDDELDNVRDYEEAHRARVAILYRIDALLVVPVETEPDAEPDKADAEDESLVTGEPGAAEAQGEVIDAAALPIAEYETLTVREILPLLPELDADELDEVREYEEAHLGRDSILLRIDALLEPYEEVAPDDEFEDEDEVPPTPAPRAVVAPESEADDEAFEEGEEYEDEEGEAPGPAEDDFPIADYDDLRVAEILPLLSQLQPDELELVAQHEEELANRSTILNRIQRLLRLSEKNSRS